MLKSIIWPAHRYLTRTGSFFRALLSLVHGMPFRQLRIVVLAHSPSRFRAPFKVSLPRIFPLSCKIQIRRSRLASVSLIWSGRGIPFASLTEPGLEKKRTKEHVTSQRVQTWKRQREVAVRLTDESTESGWGKSVQLASVIRLDYCTG